jgi:Rrf2 family transcriptional regulator, cysteine metabolism repressor
MKLSTRGRYGIRLLIDLAEQTSEPQVTLASIAQRQAISMRYLEQIAVLLKRAGYIRSIKGASGGYSLAFDPTKIVIGDVLRVLEGDLLVVDELRLGEAENALQRCIRTTVYDRLNQSIAQVVDHLTLDQMAGTIDPDSVYMYYI